MDNTTNRLHILQSQISTLRQKEKELVQENDRRFLEKAKANIGRYFYDSRNEIYAKVIVVPQMYTRTAGCFLNRYQYPTIFIGKSEGSIIPVYEDDLFYGAWGDRADSACSYKEIAPQEFSAAFAKAIDDFKQTILFIGSTAPEEQCIEGIRQ